MQFKNFVASLFVSLMIVSQAICQITYQNTNFESLARAATDAGSEFDYVINRSDEVGADGTYTFSESGDAPGYSSGASVTVEHDSELRTNGFHLTGKARSYVYDNYGYAQASANSEAAVTFTFTLSQRKRISLTGLFSLTGVSPTDYSSYFELRRSNGTLLKSSSGVGPFSFNQRLAAGTYTVSVSSFVLNELSGGGDAYDSSTATFDVSMTAR